MSTVAEQTWKQRFVTRFATRLKQGGHINDDALDVASQHADASWDVRDPNDTPEDAADGEYDALADSI